MRRFLVSLELLTFNSVLLKGSVQIQVQQRRLSTRASIREIQTVRVDLRKDLRLQSNMGKSGGKKKGKNATSSASTGPSAGPSISAPSSSRRTRSSGSLPSASVSVTVSPKKVVEPFLSPSSTSSKVSHFALTCLLIMRRSGRPTKNSRRSSMASSQRPRHLRESDLRLGKMRQVNIRPPMLSLF